MKFNTNALRPRFLDEMGDAVLYGWHRAFKYEENPSEEQIKSAIISAVESCIYEWIDFEIEEG